MALTADQIAQNIINQLRLLDPTASAAVGTPERKIIEAVSEMIAAAQVDFSVLDSQFDLDSMTGGRLDAYLGNFAFGRQAGVSSTGIVTFTSATPAARTVLIPRGTQVTATLDSSSFPTLIFTTTQTVTLEPGQTSVDSPAQCSVPGTIGNIDANQITGFAGAKNVTGITSVTNNEAFTGGVDAEDDAGYKVRFKNTMFRNMNGTYDQFLALAVSAAGVTKANVVGPISRYQEYMLIPSTDDDYQKTPVGNYDDAGTAWPHKRTTHMSSIPYSKYAYPMYQGDFVTDGDLDPATSKFYKRGVDYVLDSPPAVGAIPPTVAITTAYVEGDVVKQSAHVFICVQAGVTGGSVTLTTTTGAVTTAGSAKFKEVGAVPTDTELWTQSDPANARYDVRVATRPNVTFLFDDDGGGNPVFPDGINGDGNDVLLVEHQYISKHSRNDLRLGILNCVDVFINGSKPRNATSVEVIPPTTGHILQNTDASKWTYQNLASDDTRVVNFRRALDGKACSVGSMLVPMYWQPCTSVPNKITIGLDVYFRANFRDGTGDYWNDYDANTNTYKNEAHYLLANEVQLGVEGTIRARNGIEWINPTTMKAKKTGVDASTSYIASGWSGHHIDFYKGTQVTIKSYTFDQNVSDLQAIMEKNKSVGTDVLVHRARTRYFKLYVAIMYDPGATQSVVNAAIGAAVDAFLQNTFFGAAIQMSDLLQVIHNVPGVDNVRWAMDLPKRPVVTWNSASNPINFKVQEVYSTGDELENSTTYSGDFFLSDNELAAASSASPVVIFKRTQSTWGN